ncbi:hypothetical protein AGOR_G00213640 [Albula goreensis]|uniref:Cilia- and flagella-associated protein 36 n=1 Tax=Albula goreensis TaxID=1534307 RepID=A0A8T3CR09_9TELE|nr:hypothetical protein AGOR_G00213640 [Albula goreensis]
MADDSEWVVESIAGYLGSPEWVVPVTDFMENKCTVFDDEDENKLTYTEIHQQYKQLVERLLENYMQEVGINEQQFSEACSSPFAKSKALQTVFQPVLATDDFQMFRSLMVQKNLELQLQALRVIKERNGMLPECLTNGVDMMSELEQQEMRILQEVLKRSKEEYELEVSRRLLAEEELGSTSTSSSDRALLDSTERQDTPPAMAPAPVLATVPIPAPPTNTHKVEVNSGRQTEPVPSTQLQLPTLTNGTSSMVTPLQSCRGHSSSSATCKQCSREGEAAGGEPQNWTKRPQESSHQPSRYSQDTPRPQNFASGEEPSKGPKPPSPAGPQERGRGQGPEAWLEEARKEAGISTPFTELSTVQQEQLQQRALYLRQQRDKLQALKKEQRPKTGPQDHHIQTPSPDETIKRGVTVNGPSAEVNGSQTGSTPPAAQSKKDVTVEEKKRLQKRKHLAEKLKEEVIKK